MRRYDIDALRVIVFGLLIFYHVGMFFVSWEFHIKNSVIYEWVELPMLFVNQWRLSLLFVISGMGTYFNISKRNGWGFTKERFVRLFIPLLVGMFFIVPPQVYIERLDTGQFIGSYLAFWPSKLFIGSYPTGNLSWHHLWFLPYLWIFSLILIPAFLYLRNHPQAWIISRVKRLATHKFGLFVFAIPLICWELLLRPRFPSTHALFGDWYNIANYCTLFFYGFLLMTLKEALWENVTKNRRLYLFTGIIAFILLLFIGSNIKRSPSELFTIIVRIILAINELAWILALIGYAATYLNKPGKTLKYANEAVYPFYILHQTVIIILGYYLKNVEMGLAAKFSIMVIGTFGISWLIYEFGIRRYAWIRPLFGMKRKEK